MPEGILTSGDTRFRKTHDLVELGQECVELDPSLEGVLRQAAPLTEYAWRYRYPDDVEEPAADEVDEALTLARNVWDAINARLRLRPA